MARVSVRGGFSDRNGIHRENTEIQLRDFDERTRIRLYNLISRMYGAVYGRNAYSRRQNIQSFLRYVLSEIYSCQIDVREDYDDDGVFKMIAETINGGTYDEILTFVEAIAHYWDEYLKENKGDEYYHECTGEYTTESVYEQFNHFFQQEYVGYRFVNYLIVGISNENEIAAIEEAIHNRFDPVSNHIIKANQLLADRDNPDYANSIKESICAVESMCAIITGDTGGRATLGKTIKRIGDSGVNIHVALQSAFDKLYGYTSDEDGIRHGAGMGGKKSTFEEARFMLVACSAFVNYLMALCANNNLLNL